MAVERIKRDAHKFDECQREMVNAIIGNVVAEVEQLKLPDDQLKDLVTRIAFHVCCVLDGSQTFSKEADDIFPAVTFQAEGCADDEVISCGGGSYMHEYVHGLVETWFQPKRKIGFDI